MKDFNKAALTIGIIFMMTSSNGNNFRVTGPLREEFTGNSPVPGELPAQRPVTRSFDVFFDLRPNKRLSKQSWGWWFERPSRSLWRHHNFDTTHPHVRKWYQGPSRAPSDPFVKVFLKHERCTLCIKAATCNWTFYIVRWIRNVSIRRAFPVALASICIDCWPDRKANGSVRILYNKRPA